MSLRSLASLTLVLTLATAAFSTLAGEAGNSVVTHSRAALARPDRITCYNGQFSVFRARPRLVLRDYVARKLIARPFLPEEVCAPAAGADGRFADSTWFLTCYRAKMTTSFVSRELRAPSDEFRASTRLSLAKPSRLCIPSARIDQGGRRIASAALDRFTCYPTTSPPAIRRSDVSVSDAFGTSTDTVNSPSHLCSPAWESGSAFDRRLLTCYALQSETKGTLIVVRDRFGYLKAALGPRGRLCV